MSNEYLGSRWYKFDFHTHTPASSDYKKPEETESDWLKALMAEKVDCVAIADHVSGEWIDRLKATYAELDQSEEWYRPICLFPACEITVSTARSRVHILAIFDPSCSSAKISAVLGQCGITEGHGDAEATCATASIDDVIDIVHKADGIAIPAHIDRAKGLLHGVTNTNQEIERWVSKLESAEFIDLNFLDTVNPELAKACSHLAKVQGSDAHECSRLGKQYSWIKMSQPSIGGLRLALHDHNFCVENGIDDPNSTPDLFLKSLNISKMQHCGRIPNQPAIFNLHPLFNAVIGGRGSGKSTFIESLRLALGRENEVSELEHIQEEVRSFKDGVTTAETTICVDLQRRDESFQSIWKHGTAPYINKLQEHGWATDNGKPEERFHVSLYSQKQINALASNTNSLLEIIDRSNEVNYQGWKYQFGEELSRFLGLCREVRQLQGRLDSRSNLESQKDDLNSDIESFEQGGHKDIFNAYQTFTLEKRKVEKSASVAGLINSIDDMLSEEFAELTLTEEGEDKPDYVTELEEIQATFKGDLVAVQDELTKLKDLINEAAQRREQSISKSNWFISGEETTQKYEEVVQEYAEKGEELNPEQYEAWLTQRNEVNTQLEELKTVEANLLSKTVERGRSLRKLYILRRRLQRKRQRFIEKVIGSNRYVKMKLLPFANKSNVEAQFRRYIGVEKSFSTSIYQDDQQNSLLYKLLSDEPKLKSVISEANKLKETVLSLATGNDVENYRINTRLKTALTQSLLDKPEVFDRLVAWWPNDQLIVEYAKDIERGRFENIEKGSAGQKAAAILAFLLSHGDNPIIVDQPEDDLDNALIYQLIVSQIHENKKRRQIIMVTHNPNIVVNGDAEFVNVLHFHAGQVQVLEAGGLCEQAIRDQVCNIMEGGAAAFDKRYNRLRAL
ncbi:TrlF family AAA-like ATPase [uncultured Pseudoalteromonas sp.]|uniref:TrlF family AAA-like ATPase n=1 Tax=uncultured Pseudoalteromonas sp. TaxID=114053 RepID=UPI0025F6935B|nr:AAA family ATPase [uncultured Pseudoalteromonas sp.]|tara:strand:- start:2915 stop:5629 length:2715 start_codon:yes stop_codon:yes gene_type:complete